MNACAAACTCTAGTRAWIVGSSISFSNSRRKTATT